MPKHSQTSHSPHTPQQLFALVADVDSYSQFLPWCEASRVRQRHDDHLIADLAIGFKGLRAKYTSRVSLYPHSAIEVDMVDGPFTHLQNHWRFEAAEGGGTTIHFALDFQFKSKMMEKMIGALFMDATKRMISAFETRADELYG